MKKDKVQLGKLSVESFVTEQADNQTSRGISQVNSVCTWDSCVF